MSLIENFFGKSQDALLYADMIAFFETEREESDKIEFKAFHGPENLNEKYNGLMRSISAFLNSGGGLLIWGAPIGQTIDGRKEKVFRGDLSPVNVLLEKDALINKISDSLTPTPKGINFSRLDQDGDYIYIFDIEESEYSPHQFKNIYYMRLDGQTRPAPHHYIEALFKRIKFPRLKGFIKLERLTHNGQDIHLTFTPFILNLSKLTNEYNLYYRVLVTVGRFRAYEIAHPPHPYLSWGDKRVLNARDVLYYDEPFTERDTISFGYEQLLLADGRFNMVLYFAGKLSPLLISKYELKIDVQHLGIQNLNELFTSISENIYAHDHSDRLGKTEQQRINAFLER